MFPSENGICKIDSTDLKLQTLETINYLYDMQYLLKVFSFLCVHLNTRPYDRWASTWDRRAGNVKTSLCVRAVSH